MPQSAEKVLDHAPLFRQPEYVEMLARKRLGEEMPDHEQTAEVNDWTKSWDYREKNFQREALSVNPAKACQPLGAVFVAAGFDKCLSFVHGSQGCVAYYRSHLSRHFKEPSSIVSSSMTEDAAVFGGLNNMVDGLQNTYALYNPEMIAVSTTCMAEVIGDDLHAFITTAKNKGSVPMDYEVPFAHTPAFVGSHITGYDNMLKGILDNFWAKIPERVPNEKINIVPGFDGFAVGNNRELKRLLNLMGVEYTIISDVSEQYDTPSDGQFRMYAGGTTIQETKDALHAKAFVSMCQYCTPKSMEYAEGKGQQILNFNYPIGVAATDEFLQKISELTGKPIPNEIELERGRLIDAMADSQGWLHGKTYAVYGDPDFVYGMARFIMETGGEPRHCLATNGDKKWEEHMNQLFKSSEYGALCKAWPGRDLWHMRSLLATEKVDLLIGNSYGKYLERDVGTPLIRLAFPIFDRHHHHRFPTWGYQGGLRVLVTLLDKIFERIDEDTIIPAITDYSYDITR